MDTCTDCGGATDGRAGSVFGLCDEHLAERVLRALDREGRSVEFPRKLAQ